MLGYSQKKDGSKRTYLQYQKDLIRHVLFAYGDLGDAVIPKSEHVLWLTEKHFRTRLVEVSKLVALNDCGAGCVTKKECAETVTFIASTAFLNLDYVLVIVLLRITPD